MQNSIDLFLVGQPLVDSRLSLSQSGLVKVFCPAHRVLPLQLLVQPQTRRTFDNFLYICTMCVKEGGTID
jgi:hypothetical protein